MVVFLLTALFTAIPIAGLLFTRPPRRRAQRRIFRILIAAGLERRRPELRIVALLICFLSLTYGAIVAFGALHDRRHPVFGYYEYLNGSQFTHLVMGVLLGVIIPFWIAAVYRVDPAQKWPVSLYLETAFLLIMVFLGTSEAFSPLWNRLTSVPTPWGALTLAAAVSDNHLTAKPDRDKYTAGSTQDNDATFAPNFFGLDAIETLSKYILTDRLLVDAGGPGQSRIAQESPLDGLLDQAMEPMASCHLHLVDTSGEASFTRMQYSALIPSFARFVEHQGEKDSKALALVLLKLSSQLLRRVYLEFPDWDDAARDKACGKLLRLPCRILPFPEAGDVRGQCVNACGQSKCENRNGAPLAFSGWNLSEPLVNALATRLQKTICHVAGSSPSIEMFEEACPYLILLYAAITNVAGETWMGHKRLIGWINASIPNEDNGVLDLNSWTRVRLLSYFASSLDQSSDRSAKMQDLRFAVSTQLVKSLRALKFTEQGLTYLRASPPPATFTDDTAFESAPTRLQDCPTDVDAKLKINVALAYLTDAFAWIDLAEQRSEDWNRYALPVAEYLHEMHLDFSCLRLVYSNSSNKANVAKGELWQAEIRRLEAKRLLLDTAADSELFGATERHERLTRALTIADTGQNLLAPYYKEITAKIDDLSDYNPNLKSVSNDDSNIVATYRQFSVLKSEIKARQKEE